MKICKFTEYDLRNRSEAREGKFHLIPTATERAIQLLLATLEMVNKAGLEGNELHGITLVTRSDYSKHPDDRDYEIHAKVRHRLKAP